MTTSRRIAATCAALTVFHPFGFLTRAAYAEVPAAQEPWRHNVTLSRAAQVNEGLTFSALHTATLHEQISAMAGVVRDAARSVMIRPAGDGKVLTVNVIPGQRVTKGAVLAVYRDHSLHSLYLEQAQADAALASAKAACIEAEKSYRRGMLLRGSTISDSEVERRFAVLQQQRAICAAAQAHVDLTQHRLTEEFSSATEAVSRGEVSNLIAPLDGVVQMVDLAVNDDIKSGTTVMSLVDLAHVWIVAHVRPQDAASLQLGGIIVARPAGRPDANPVYAKITTIDGVSDPATGLIGVTSIIDNVDGALRPGEMLDARLATNAMARGLVVPLSAIQTIEGHDVVFVQRDAQSFIPHEVRIKLATDAEAVIESDLPEGQSIVVQGSFALKSIALLSSSEAL